MSNLLPRCEIVRELKRDIVAGTLPAGQRLPTEAALTTRFRVSRGTVRRALAELVEHGLLTQRPGVGCFVSDSIRTVTSGRRITFLHPPMTEVNFRLLHGMESRAVELGCEFCMRHFHHDTDELEDVLAQLRNTNSSGVVYLPFVVPNYYEVNSRILDRIESVGLRHVVVDTPISSHGVIRGDFIGDDGYTAMRDMIRHLYELGYRRIGSIRVFAGVYSSDQRFRGVFDQLAAYNLPLAPELHRVIEDSPVPEQGRQRIRELMALPHPPEVVLCTHDAIALNVMDELRRMGKRIPEDVALVGFDDYMTAEPLGLTSIRQPLVEIGRRAVEVLLQDSPGRSQEFLPCQLIYRQSIQNKEH